jgi:hypothetical protein
MTKLKIKSLQYPAKSNEVLIKFIAFCQENPHLRFWQALYSFTGAERIRIDTKDPFYWEGRNA